MEPLPMPRRHVRSLWIGDVAVIMATFVAAVMLCFMAVIGGALVLGYRPVVVTSGSMAPVVEAGDIVLVKPHNGESLGPPQVIHFVSESHDSGFLHRIIAVEDGSYVTKGDANPSIDSATVAGSSVSGVARVLVPGVGRLLLFFGDPSLMAGLLLIVVVGAAIVLTRQQRHLTC